MTYLCTDQAWNINGQIFYVFGGSVCLAQSPIPMRTIYKSEGWTLDELVEVVPKQLTQFIDNPAPPADHLRPGNRAEETSASG